VILSLRRKWPRCCASIASETAQEGGGAVEAEAERPGGDCLLRRRARYSGDCNDVPRSAAPEPGVHATFARDHEYKRHGTISLLAGIDFVTGKVHVLVEDRHRSRGFVAFLKRLGKAYSVDTAIHLILDNHSAHISRETKAWLAEQPAGRFKFTFTPKHGIHTWTYKLEEAA
jgi:DDE superfamily endonuclease